MSDEPVPLGAIPILDHPVKPDDDNRMDEIAAPSF
jgi:hypothetical protein